MRWLEVYSMSDLDEKLNWILKSNAAVQVNFDTSSFDDYQNLIPDIKQAFADAGYVDASRMLKLSVLMSEQAKILADMAQSNLPPIYGTGLMTGQEWYERFLDEINKDKSLIPALDTIETPESMSDWVLRIAAKAAGLES